MGLNIFLGILITVSSMYGLKSLNVLAAWTVPLLLITLIYCLYSIEKREISAGVSTSLQGISMVIGSIIVGVIDLPTYYRHSRSLKDSFVSIALVFAVILSFLEGVGVYLAYHSPGETFLNVLKGDRGNLWSMWVVAFLVLAGWTTNNLNIYSGAIYLGHVLKDNSYMKNTMLFGCVGIFCACINFLDHFELALNFMSIFIGSMGATVTTRYFFSQFQEDCVSENLKANLLAWMIGVGTGMLSIMGLSATSIAVLDAAFGSCIAIFFALAFSKRRVISEAD